MRGLYLDILSTGEVAALKTASLVISAVLVLLIALPLLAVGAAVVA